MAMKIRIKVPDIMKERGLDVNELMWGAKLSLNTAKRWADPVDAKEITRADFDVIEGIRSFLQVDSIGDLLDFEDVDS